MVIIIYLEGFTADYSTFSGQILQLFFFKLNNALLAGLKSHSIPDRRSFLITYGVSDYSRGFWD